MKYAAAVDIGRVKVQVALFDESYNIVDHQVLIAVSMIQTKL